jgi:aquaporin Z
VRDTTWHWPEYLIEASALGTFMISASLFTVLLEHPDSPVARAISDPVVRRLLMGLAMGLTAIAIIYSPAGARSGAHMNPATTVTFYRLGRVRGQDAVGYIAAQFVGALVGLIAARAVLASALSHPRVNYVATLPGPWGVGAAFAGEVAIAAILMTVVLVVSNGRHHRWTGAAAGALVAVFILVEAPVSGMSLNPARSLAPAIFSASLDTFWIYLIAPPTGMFLAAALYTRRRGLGAVLCARLNHTGPARCIFRCRRGESVPATRQAA